MYQSVSVDALPIGVRLSNSIYDDRQTKLLGAGVAITGPLLESLRRRNVRSVVVSGPDVSRLLAFRPQGKARSVPPNRGFVRVSLENDVSRDLDQQIVGQSLPRLAPSTKPFVQRVKHSATSSYDSDLTGFLIERREEHVNRATALAEACVRGEGVDLREPNEIVHDALAAAVEDVDAFACLAVNPHSQPYPMCHATHTAMIAVAVGITLGFDEQRLLELGMGCLLHDVAMLRVDRMVLGARKFLEPLEFSGIAEHPVRVLKLIEGQIDVVPNGARLVAYQLHERCNGSGYPRGRTINQTHPLARVAAVADVYAALVAERPHRPGMLPYYAMEKLIKEVAAGLFDGQVVRALLQTVSLFPLGSYVELSRSYVGRVIRPNYLDFTRPVVELWKKGAMNAGPVVVDLAQEPELRIVRPLTNLAA